MQYSYPGQNLHQVTGKVTVADQVEGNKPKHSNGNISILSRPPPAHDQDPLHHILLHSTNPDEQPFPISSA